MAENVFYDSAAKTDVERELVEEDTYKQIIELVVNEREKKSSKCERCVRKGLFESVAVFLCFVCEIYVCAECMGKHGSHGGMEVGERGSDRQIKKEESERMGGRSVNEKKKKRKKRVWERKRNTFRKSPESEREKDREKSDSDKMKEQREKETILGQFVDNLMNESESKRRKELKKKSHVSVCDRFEVKHELDQMYCWISGLCGLENRRLVVCDYWNYCIKIFKLGSHVLQRYIRFVESFSGPRDVTEIDLKHNSTEPNLVSGSSSDISGTDRADPDKQCLIAVTLPGERQIMFIDLSKKPAKAQKTIKTEKECWSIQFYDDKIFTVCSEVPDSRCFVYIYSTDGNTLNKFDIDSYRYLIPGPDLAVVSGRVYITDKEYDKVECRNVEGQLISEITIERSGPVGISVDSDNNVYVCAQWHNKVYKLDADLTRYKSVLDQTTDYIEIHRVLCYYRDKLFISHARSPSLRNFVTVVRLL